MKITNTTLQTFKNNLFKYAQDTISDLNPDKVLIIKSAAGVIAQVAYDLHNGNAKEKIDAIDYLVTDDFIMYSKLLGLSENLSRRMVIDLDNDIVDYDSIDELII